MSHPSQRPMSHSLVVLLLSLLMGLQPIATDLYLPSLPDLTRSLSGGMAQAQLTLTAMLLGFGLSQLAWGPLSDRFGRRPILVTGMGLFTLASIGAVLSGSMHALIGWRAALFAAAVLAMPLWRQQETLQPARLLANWKLILRHPTFWCQAVNHPGLNAEACGANTLLA